MSARRDNRRSQRRLASFRVDLTLQTNDLNPSLKRWLPREFKRIAAIAGVDAGAVSLVVVDDAAMSELHGQYKGDASTTDVLTFDLREEGDDPIEGDIVLCADEASRQASARGHDTRTELLLYAVHGLLHLMGYDDHRPADYRRMHRKEDDLLKAAGYGAVFAKKLQTTKSKSQTSSKVKKPNTRRTKPQAR